MFIILLSEKPNTPLGPVRVTYHSDTQAKIDWKRPLNSPQNLRYKIVAIPKSNEYDLSTSCRNNNQHLTHFIVADNTHYLFSGLTPGESYHFEISAFNHMGNSSAIMSDTLTMINPLYYTPREFTEEGFIEN